jgi:hypothetical protein
VRRRQCDDRKPKGNDFTDNAGEVLVVDRLGDVAVRVIRVLFNDVVFGARGGENNDGDLLEIHVAFDFR